mmetsp:Transcript_164799/g.528754  ORF Transcript_164799/g.528754 Transcript_164799/m.528754 type:complete len:650 (-) Transcript_164799:311-2260(-)
MLVTSAPQDTSALHGFGGAGAPLSILALTLCQAVLSSHASSADLKLPRADAEELGANAKAGQLSPAPTMACGRTALGFGECRELPAPPPRWGDAHRMAGGSGPSSSEVRSVHVPRCWWNMTADPCCDGCDYHMCCLWPSLLRLTWQEFLQPCAARGAAACEELAVRAEREAIALAPRFAAAHQAGEVDAATRFLVLLQARLILLAVLGFFSLLEAASAVLESASSGLTYSFAQDKDPDPCYCGHGLGLHEATKNVFVELMAAPRFRERMLEPMDMTNTFIRFQSCELLAPTAEWPIEHMLTLVVNAECVPSHLVTVLICAQQRILHQDLLRAFLFAVAALMGASFVPRCLTGARTGSRSAWPFTLSDVARHVRSIFGVLTAGGDPHDAAWTSGPLEEQEAPRPDSPCMQELAGACVVSGELHTLVSDVRYCDEEGVHTLEVEPHQSVKQASMRTGWLLPVMSFYNPWHSLLWAVSAYNYQTSARRVDVLILWPTGIAEQELRERWTAPFRRLAELLAADVRLASEVDECFDWLRVGRGHLLDATAYAVRARPAHFHALARAVVARYPASDTIEEDSCSLPGGRRGLQLGVGRHTVGQQLEASHPEVRRRCTGPTPIPVASAHIQHQGRRWCPRRSVGIHRLFANTCCIG